MDEEDEKPTRETAVVPGGILHHTFPVFFPFPVTLCLGGPMPDQQFQMSVRAQASLFLDHLAQGHFRQADRKMTSMTYFWHGATFAGKALGHTFSAKFPALWTAWDQLHTAWCALDRLGDESGELQKLSEAQVASLMTLAKALRDRAIEAGAPAEG